MFIFIFLGKKFFIAGVKKILSLQPVRTTATSNLVLALAVVARHLVLLKLIACLPSLKFQMLRKRLGCGMSARNVWPIEGLGRISRTQMNIVLKEDEELREDLWIYVDRYLKRAEILDFVKEKFP